MDRGAGLATMTEVNSETCMNEPGIFKIFASPSLDPVEWSIAMS